MVFVVVLRFERDLQSAVVSKFSSNPNSQSLVSSTAASVRKKFSSQKS